MQFSNPTAIIAPGNGFLKVWARVRLHWREIAFLRSPLNAQSNSRSGRIPGFSMERQGLPARL
jgi:hypothetical protein